MPCNCIDRDTLKSYFQQCATPTEQNFIDLIDAFFHACEDDTICNNLLVEGSDGFNQSGETASLFLGDQHHSIQSTNGKGVTINTYGVNDALFIEQGTGKVGIGTTTPNKKLDVNGDANIQGTLCADDLDIRGNVNVQGTITATSLNIAGSGLVPVGAIIMWSGSTTPTGWALCDGTNGTPDLRGRFIVGFHPGDTDYDTIGHDGGVGKKEVTLSNNEIPSHNHAFSGTTSDSGYHNHTYQMRDDNNNNDDNSGYPETGKWDGTAVSGNTDHTPAHQHTFNGTTDIFGSGQAHENRPPYYVLAYIMKL